MIEATDAYLGAALGDYPRRVIAEARIESSPEGFRLRLALVVDGTRERHDLSGPDCDQLGRDVALLIATAVDPFDRGPRPPAERQLLAKPVVVQYPSARPPTRPSPAPTPTASKAPEPEPPRARELLDAAEPVDIREPAQRRPAQAIEGTLGVAGTSFAGVFPQIGGGVAIEGGLERGRFRWQASGQGWFGGEFRAPGSAAGADLWAATGSTGFCFAPALRRVRFAACATVGVGAITVTSINTDTQRTLARPWAHAGAELRATWTPRPRLGVYLGVGVLPALTRPGWFVTNPDASFRVPPVAGALQLGLELRKLGAR